MTSNACNTVSLYIPIISKNITESYVKQQFFQHKIGCVKNVDFVFNNQKNRREAFIHFKVWFDNKKAKELLTDIKNEKTTKKVGRRGGGRPNLSAHWCAFFAQVNHWTKHERNEIRHRALAARSGVLVCPM